jgi:hypothetical protein
VLVHGSSFQNSGHVVVVYPRLETCQDNAQELHARLLLLRMYLSVSLVLKQRSPDKEQEGKGQGTQLPKMRKKVDILNWRYALEIESELKHRIGTWFLYFTGYTILGGGQTKARMEWADAGSQRIIFLSACVS